MGYYKVMIADTQCPLGEEMGCEAANAAEARRKGREYIRAWDLREARVLGIRLVPGGRDHREQKQEQEWIARLNASGITAATEG